jgi:hypothetical protein
MAVVWASRHHADCAGHLLLVSDLHHWPSHRTITLKAHWTRSTHKLDFLATTGRIHIAMFTALIYHATEPSRKAGEAAIAQRPGHTTGYKQLRLLTVDPTLASGFILLHP